jgi:hypothetical protein
MDYFLLDLERTLSSGVPCYWKQNKHGYTYNIEQAGLFTEEQATEVVSSDLDKTTVKIHYKTVEKILVKELKRYEGT